MVAGSAAQYGGRAQKWRRRQSRGRSGAPAFIVLGQLRSRARLSGTRPEEVALFFSSKEIAESHWKEKKGTAAASQSLNIRVTHLSHKAADVG